MSTEHINLTSDYITLPKPATDQSQDVQRTHKPDFRLHNSAIGLDRPRPVQ